MSGNSHNSGVIVERPPSSPGSPAFYLVLGSPRGGTTMIAKCLATLGIFMGDKLPYTGEDPFLARFTLQGDFQAVADILRNRCDIYPRHGWKFPPLLQLSKDFDFLPPATRLILIFRDLVATAVRGHIATDHSTRTEMWDALRYNERMLQILQSLPYPALLLSYEKCLNSPSRFISALCGFVGIDNPARAHQAVRSVQLSPAVYRHRDSELKRKMLSAGFVGCLDSMTGIEIVGWAFRPATIKEYVEVRFTFESGVAIKGKADELREGLKAAGLHPTGKCGFCIKIPRSHRPLPGQYVTAQDDKTGIEFEGSPFMFTEYLE